MYLYDTASSWHALQLHWMLRAVRASSFPHLKPCCHAGWSSALKNGAHPRWGWQVERVEGLTVRVVSNVKKRAEVKPRFLDAFQQAEDFPSDLPYTQKVGPGAINPCMRLATSQSSALPDSSGPTHLLLHGSSGQSFQSSMQPSQELPWSFKLTITLHHLPCSSPTVQSLAPNVQQPRCPLSRPVLICGSCLIC